MATTPPHRPAAADALPEQFGPYCILRRLGEGGMGTVYLAQDTRLDRPVALKVCHLGDHPQALERFRREAKAAAALRHSNLCPVYEYDVREGVPYLVMAYIEGPTLAEHLRQQGPLPQREAAQLVRRLALAMHEAHRHGVIHRDLKPSNVALDERGEPVILDFGLALHQTGGEVRLTHSGAVLGTPAYMAPEQVRGDTAAMTPACDIYSLGVILYELLAGVLPFHGPTATVLGQILYTDPPPPSQWRSDLDPRLEAACLGAMAKKPARRYPDMAALAAALEEVLAAGDASTAPELSLIVPEKTRNGFPRPENPTRSAVQPDRTAALAAASPQRDRRLSVTIAAGTATFLLVGGLVSWLLFGGRAPPERRAEGGPALGQPDAKLQPTERKQPSPPRAPEQQPAGGAPALGLPLADMVLTPGQAKRLEVHLEQANGNGVVQLEAFGLLPDGVAAESGQIAPGVLTGHLKLTARQDAPSTEWLARLAVKVEGIHRREAPFRLTIGRPLPRELTNSVGMRLAPIPAGQFRMGSPPTERSPDNDSEEGHDVTITRPFYLGVCEVTQRQYQTIMGNNPSRFKGDDHPVERVSWDDCQEFCKKLGQKESKRYRLTTEAEWEYACRAGAWPTPFHCGRSLRGKAATGPFLNSTKAVGSYPANAFGLFDMHGNVCEWCQDWYVWDIVTLAKKNPQGAPTGTLKVVRGGSWRSDEKNCRAACRGSRKADAWDDDVGFRVVLEVEPTR